MFWTHWSRGACKVIMTLGVLASILIGGFFIVRGYEYSDYYGYPRGGYFYLIVGFVIMVGGTCFVTSSVSRTMMISEISLNIEKIARKQQPYFYKQYTRQDNSYEERQAEMSRENAGTSPDGWYCRRCGTKNDITEKLCKECGMYK